MALGGVAGGVGGDDKDFKSAFEIFVFVTPCPLSACQGQAHPSSAKYLRTNENEREVVGECEVAKAQLLPV